MALKDNKKGMAAVIDAFMFITIIGLIAAGMFAYSSVTDDKEAKAKEVHDAFFSIELKTEDLFDDTDTQKAMMCDLLAAYMVTGDGNVYEYAENVLRSVVPPVYGYTFIINYDDRVLTFGDGGGRLTSRYSSDILTSGGKVMHTELSLY